MESVAKSAEHITRREAILRVSALFGGVALVGQGAMLTACSATGTASRPARGDVLSASAVALLDEVADTILPETSTPGAKAAGVGPFMAVMVRDTYDPQEQRIFLEGLETLERECNAMHGVGFMNANAAQRLALLERLDREQFEFMSARSNTATPHYFRMIKELSLLGYFTSEIGYTQAMRYIEVPGRFDPCLPYTPGEKAWAPHA